jgi:hypothetical protein
MTMTGTLGVSIDLTDNLAGDLDTSVARLLKTFGWTLVGGTGSGKVDKAWSDERTLAASANEDIDVSGSLTGVFGAFAPAKLKAVVVYALPTNTNSVIVSRPAANGVPFLDAASDAVTLTPGSVLCATNLTGWTVTAGTGDLINIANSAGTTGVTYRIALLGASA